MRIESLSENNIDDYIDYYRLEVGEDQASQEIIKKKIIASFCDARKKGSQNYNNERPDYTQECRTIQPVSKEPVFPHGQKWIILPGRRCRGSRSSPFSP